MREATAELPAHDLVAGWTRRIEICALIAAGQPVPPGYARQLVDPFMSK
jgi:hypothetical protein